MFAQSEVRMFLWCLDVLVSFPGLNAHGKGNVATAASRRIHLDPVRLIPSILPHVDDYGHCPHPTNRT